MYVLFFVSDVLLLYAVGYDEVKPVISYVADITKPETLFPEMFEGVDCVFHVAAKTGFSHFPPVKELEEVNVNGMTRVPIHKMPLLCS